MDLRAMENESLLLLYLMDELPPHDRNEVAAMLHTDASLREQLRHLAETLKISTQAMRRLDELDPVIPSFSAKQRLEHAIRQWNIDRLARPAVAEPARRRIPLWMWSGGGAVAAVLAFCIWWGISGDFDSGSPVPLNGDSNLANANSSYGTDANSNPAVAETDPFSPRRVLVSSLDQRAEVLDNLEQTVREDLR
ncbi:MAG: hypothetical protein JO353_10695 [Phycisphaerae bacterium]|nr:hypothetical protein [Phycisphaerae bacterium]